MGGKGERQIHSQKRSFEKRYSLDTQSYSSCTKHIFNVFNQIKQIKQRQGQWTHFYRKPMQYQHNVRIDTMPFHKFTSFVKLNVRVHMLKLCMIRVHV